MLNNLPSLLLNCDAEPIHLCGEIQPHGFLFAVNQNSNTVEFVSRNVSSFIDVHPDFLLKLSPLKLREYLESAGSLTSFTTQDMEVFEVERIPNSSSSEEVQNVLRPKLLAAIESLSCALDISSLFNVVATSIQQLCGYQRVMVYRFEEDWSGTVVGESISAGSYESFLNLRFPADDIPRQARELYRLNQVRYIPDVAFNAEPILSAQSATIDLSLSLLRGVSSVHLEYLRNMNVAASMSFSLIVKGKLWGLIACHNAVSRYVDPSVRSACTSVCKLVSSLIEMRVEAAFNEENAKSRTSQLSLLSKLATFNDPAVALDSSSGEILSMVNAAGLVLVEPNTVLKKGVVPGDLELKAILSFLNIAHLNTAVSRAVVTDELRLLVPDLSSSTSLLESAAGMFAGCISQTPPIWLLLFRPELIAETHWAGEPVKLIDEERSTLHPRRSFKLWKETVAGKSRPWTPVEIGAVRVLIDYLHQRFAADARFSAALEAAPQMMLVVDSGGIIHYFNRSAQALLEPGDGEGLRGKSIKAVLPDGVDTRKVLTSQGREIPVEVVQTPLNTAQGLFSLFSVTDVSQRINAEQERIRLTLALQDSNQKMEQFVDTIAHDLRAPLLAIDNLANWIASDLGKTLTGAPLENLQTLRQRTVRVRNQLTALLDYSKAGSTRAALETVDTQKLVTSIFESIDADKKYQLNLRDMPTFITVEAPLEHVFSNLLENAVKYGEPRTVIVVSCEDGGSFFKFRVANEGRGIPLEYQQEVFYPLRSLGTSDEKGYGMGLAFVKRIVEQSGGSVTLESAPAMGAKFTFTWKKRWRD